jgi:hypothetical protein
MRLLDPNLIAMAGLIVLGGCLHSRLNTPHAGFERGETWGELTYQGVVLVLNDALAKGRISPAVHDGAWRQAWSDLSLFRRAYDAGADLSGPIGRLEADLKAAKEGASR